MTKKQFRTRLRLLTVLTLLLIVLVSYASGKYSQTVRFNANVKFEAKLAESITLQEHVAVRQADGSYQLNQETTDSGNSYNLIPGLDIPKDPCITIVNKTPVSAYLFVEVVDALDTDSEGNKPVTYGIADGWTLIEGLAGKNGGAVYIYTNPKELTEQLTRGKENYTFSIPILADDKVTVSQHLLHQSVSDENDVLTFYATMGEIGFAENDDIADEIEVYWACCGRTQYTQPETGTQ